MKSDWLVGLHDPHRPEDAAALGALIVQRMAAGHQDELEQVLAALPVGVFVAHDAGCTDITANPAGAAILRIAPGRNASKTGPDGSELPFRVLRDGVEVAGAELPMQRAARTGCAIHDEEFDLVFDDGTTRRLHEHAVPLFDAAGEVCGCVGVFSDISERVRAEEALRASQALLDGVFTASAVGLAVLTPAARFVRVNAAFGAITGYTADELSRIDCAALTHVDDVEGLERALARLEMRQVRAVVIEQRYLHKDGHTVWVRNSVSAILDAHGRTEYLVAVSEDISARKRQDEALYALRLALTQQVADLTRLHDQAAALVGQRDPSVVLDDLLASALAIAGGRIGMVTLSDAQRDDLEVVATAGLPPAVAEQLCRIPRGVGACGEAYRRGARVVVEDTERDPLFDTVRDLAREAGFRSAHATPLLARDGRVLGVLTTCDAVPRRPSERETRMADLLARHAAGYLEHRQMVDALQLADRRKDEFLATLAHELRNPLAPIRNVLHLLRLDGAAAQSERLHEMLERQVGHMVRLVDDLMEVSRISRGSIVLQRETLDLGSVLRTAIETSRPLIEQGRHTLETACGCAAPLQVDGDAVRLAQVFANLLNNAAKYTDAGGRIEIACAREGDRAVVTVRDDGIGIAAEQLPRLFDMFAQVDRGSARAQGGLGIGLSLVQRLVQMHGGSVQATSAGLGQGSCFTVRLPLAC